MKRTTVLLVPKQTISFIARQSFSIKSSKKVHLSSKLQRCQLKYSVKAAYSVTMDIFRKTYILFKSFVKVELSFVFTVKMFSTAKNCMEK